MAIRRPLVVTGAVTFALVLAAASQATLRAQSGSASTYAPPRTPWGDPDLQGVWPVTSSVGIPMQRPRELGTRAVLTEQEFQARAAQSAKQLETDNAEFEIETADTSNAGEVGSATSPPPHWLERGRPSRQASLVVEPADGRTPPLTAEAQARAKTTQDARRGRGPADSWEDRSYWDRCVTRGPVGSMLPTVYNAGNEIVQAPGYVVIRNEMIHEARVVPLDGRTKPGDNLRTPVGQSRGRWEGNTLVVETTNFSPEVTYRNVSAKNLRLIERYTRIAPHRVEWTMTIDNPSAWSRPWTYSLPMTEDDKQIIHEYACHEGNFGMANLLSAGREADKGKAAK